VEPETIARLLELNRRFYQELAPQFSATRQRLQPGVQRILERLPSLASILDLGCGNGELARRLAGRGHTGAYLGLDSSPALLEEAARRLPPGFPGRFRLADLAQAEWSACLPPEPFDFILAFAVLHHLPGAALRRRLLGQVRACLAPGGQLIHANWQFLNSPRWRQRIQPWEQAGLAEGQVEPGDCLLDWRSGGRGLRYVHHFSAQELAGLASATGFEIVESFASDGQEGNLGLYQAWQIAPG
jgi:SAM-dependent methyltransferase